MKLTAKLPTLAANTYAIHNTGWCMK